MSSSLTNLFSMTNLPVWNMMRLIQPERFPPSLSYQLYEIYAHMYLCIVLAVGPSDVLTAPPHPRGKQN